MVTATQGCISQLCPIYGHSGSNTSLNVTAPHSKVHCQCHVWSTPWLALPLSMLVLGHTA